MSSKNVHDPDELTPLARWLVAECEQRGITWAEGSRRAGLTKTMISQIVRQYRPGLKACDKLAHAFGRSPVEVLELAGWLSSAEGAGRPRGGEHPSRELPGLGEVTREIRELRPEQRAVVLKLWRDALVNAYEVVATAERNKRG
jgi:transcriptional regulator with XRE-family HTH domain